MPQKDERNNVLIGKWGLLPLTPHYSGDHAPYVEALEDCLAQPSIHNIALTGNYGVGKSSILSKVAETHVNEVVQISLSTIAPIKPAEVDEAVPKQATSTTNQIQREIVKQLLYSQPPKAMPESRFKRIGRPSFMYQTCLSLYSGLLCSILLLITGWYKTLFSSLHVQTNWKSLLIVFLFCSVLCFGLIEMLRGKIHLKSFSAGPASVTLDEQSVSYFDQYLDEIKYYFDKSQRTIVIFEDLDRFNDSNIFETLRALNSLLNSSNQYKMVNETCWYNKLKSLVMKRIFRKTDEFHPIRFIYAVKDSIFDTQSLEKGNEKYKERLKEDVDQCEDPAETESIRANRTKFFDIVIQVVPFISHSTAGSLIIKQLGQKSSVSPWLTDLAGRYITDMRLLKNICNEYTIFQDRLNSGDGKNLKLNNDQIFAMTLYKNTSMRQFELMRIRKSDIDNLYMDYRLIVSQNISSLEEDIRELQRRQTQINEVSKRSEQLAAKLLTFIDLEGKLHDYSAHDADIQVNGRTFKREAVKQEDFWSHLAGLDNGEHITVTLHERNYRPYHYNLDVDDLPKIIGTSLQADTWEAERLSSINNDIVQRQNLIEYLRSTDMSGLLTRPEFTLDASKMSGRFKRTNQIDTDAKQSFDQLARQRLGEGLVYELVRKGAINRDYILYAQTYYGNRVSAAAKNFIHQQINPNVMDIHLKLEDQDIENILRENTGNNLAERAFYNSSILDYILVRYDNRETDGSHERLSGSDGLMTALASLGNDERVFLQAYFESGSGKPKDILVPLLIKYNTDVVNYLISGIELNDQDRIHWVDLALKNLSSDRDYEIDEASAEYLHDNLENFAVLKQSDVSLSVVESIGKLLREARTRVKTLSVFADEFVSEFVNENMFEINRENLTVIAKPTDVSLDAIKAVQSESVYNNILSHLQDYLEALDDSDHTIETSSQFHEILNDASKKDGLGADTLDRIIQQSGEECRISSAASLEDHDLLEPLVKYSKIVPTYENVIACLRTAVDITQQLADLLNAQHGIVDVPTDEDSFADREGLASDIINARKGLFATDFQIQLVKDLHLETYLDVDEITSGDSLLFAELIKQDIIADDKKTFLHIQQADWDFREKAISESKRFTTFMDTTLIHPQDLQCLMKSKLVSDDVKNTVLNGLSSYIADAGPTGAEAVAEYAISKKYQCDQADLLLLTAQGMETSTTIKLICLNAEALGIEFVHLILNQLPDNFGQLTSSGTDCPKIPMSKENLELVEYLKSHGAVVSSFKTADDCITVYKHH